MPYSVEAVSKLLIALPKFPPIVKGWNRLEGRPRTVDYTRALRAEVRDALWFLTRQWQFGEFQGEDAGSPVDARTVIRATPLQRDAAGGGPAVPYDKGVPLETRVEREPIPRDLALHIQVSRYFFALIASQPNRAAIGAHYRAHYPLTPAAVAGHPDADAEAMFELAAAHVLDAGRLIKDIAGGLHTAVVSSFGLSSQEESDLAQAAKDLALWFSRLYAEPDETVKDAWAPSVLEYQFACAVEAQGVPQTVLLADAYTTGHLDWHAFDIDARAGAALDPPEGGTTTLPILEDKALSFLPAPVSFGGMPSHRYWEMENRRTEFADIDANTTDIAKLLLTEFALVYSNDWCVIPYEVDVGTLCEVRGLLLTDDFGEQILVRPAGRGVDDTWQRWSMFTMSTNRADGQADVRLFLPPALTKEIEGAPIEKVHFLRDEMANMAWAIERIVPTAFGAGINGYSAAAAAPGSSPAAAPASDKPRYVLGTEVPLNWFPFMPVHVAGGNRAVQLQRARMPRGGPIRGRILDVRPTYLINEEEVPRAGKIVSRSYQRARWLDGRTFLWIGKTVTTGRGEGASGLAFDQVREPNKAKS